MGKDTRAIGVFDSGIGGLTAMRELTALLPNEHIIYFGDTGRVPYGTRSRETIIHYSRQNAHFLKSFDVKFLNKRSFTSEFDIKRFTNSGIWSSK